MNKQVIAFIAVMIALSGGLGTALVSCFNAQQDALTNLNQAFIDQSERHDKKITELHSDYNAKIIDLIIKGR